MSAAHFFFFFFKVRASKQVTRSRRSSVWPIPFFGRLLTSQSETEAGPREESWPRGTEAVCPCSAPVGRSHTLGVRGGGESRPEGGILYIIVLSPASPPPRVGPPNGHGSTPSHNDGVAHCVWRTHTSIAWGPAVPAAGHLPGWQWGWSTRGSSTGQ